MAVRVFIIGAIVFMFGCRPMTAVVVVDREYDWRNAYPRIAVVTSPDSEHSVALRVIVIKAIENLDFGDCAFLMTGDYDNAKVEARKAGAEALVAVEAIRMENDVKERDGVSVPSGKDPDRSHDSSVAVDGRALYRYYVAVKMFDIRKDALVYDVRYAYNSSSKYLDTALCVKKLLQPMAALRRRGNWKEYGD